MALTKIDDRGLKTPIDLLTNEKIRFGTGNDLEIYHDSNGIIHNKTGQTWIQGSELYLSSNHTDLQEVYLKAVANGAVQLFYDGGTDPMFETTSTGAEVNSSTDATLRIANAQDGTAKLTFHNTGSTNFHAQITDGVFTIETVNDAFLKAHADAQLELFYNGSRKFYTATTGAVITNNNAPNTALDSTPVKLVLHNSTDHNWDHNEHCGAIIFRKGTGEESSNTNNIVAGITATHSRSVGAPHTNEDGGIQIWTSPSANPTVPVQVWEFDSGGHFLGKDNNKIQLGEDQDFRIYYSGSTNILECRNSKELHINNAEASNLAKFIPGGAAELFFDGTSAGKKLETLATGVQITGNLKIGTAGNGIDFSAQTWTSTGNTNDEVLDHYEEGTFIPTLSGTSSNPTQSYAHQRASFTRIGNLVHITVDVEMAGSGVSAGSGNLCLSGLPWPKNSAASNLGSGAGPAYGVSCSVGLVANLGSNYPNAAYANDNDTYLLLTRTTASSWAYCSAAAITNSSRVIIGATYRTTG